MGDENVVAVQVTAEVGPYVDAMKQAASATTASMDAVKVATANGAQGASAAIDALKAQLATLQASYSTQGQEVAGLKESLAALSAELAGVRQPAEAAESAVKSLGDRIKEKVSEQRSEGRLGTFIARDLQRIVPASGEAAGAVAGLVSGFAFAGGMGLAIEGVKLLVEAIMSAGKESEKLAAQAEATTKKWREQTDAIIAGIKGESQAQKVFHDQVATSASTEFDLKQKLLGANATLSKAEAQLADATANHSAAAQAVFGQEVDHARAVVEELDRQLAVQKEITKFGSADVKKVDVAEKDKAAEAGFLATLDAQSKYGAERQKIDQQVEQKLLEMHAQALDGNEKLEAEYVKKLAEIDQMPGTIAVQREALKTAQLQAYRKQLSDFAAEQAKLEVERQKQADEDLLKSAEQITTGIREQMQARKKAYDQATAAADEGAKKILEDQRQSAREQLATVRELASGVGQAFAGIVSGTESVGKAFAEMASAAIKALVDLAIKSVEASAVKAGGEAAASQAGIPIIGPALAIAAMAATEAAVLGLLSSLPSAAGGWGEVPHDLTANIHKGEQVWPAQYAEGGRQLLTMLADGSFSSGGSAQQVFADDGGGGGGDEIHVHFHVPAGAFLDQTTANRFIADPMVQKAISNAVRLGRWGNG